MNNNYYFTETEWSRTVGYGSLPEERQRPTLNEEHQNGEQQLNKSTGEVEVYYNGDWTVR